MLAVGVCVMGLGRLEVLGASSDVASSNSGCSTCHVSEDLSHAVMVIELSTRVTTKFSIF